MDKQCVGCVNNYFDFLAEYHRNNDAGLLYLQNHSVLLIDLLCPDCKTPCEYKKDRHHWVCGS